MPEKNPTESKWKAWLLLMRWRNLLIIALTQLVAWSCAIVPVPGLQVLRPFPFLLLCLSTLFIAAGGYIINDYFDIRIDVINKPDKVILERIIPRKQAIIVHSLLNILAILLAALLAIPAGHPEWLLLQVFCTALLWRYSTHWKRQFMIGNVAVSLMTALTIVVLILYEPALHGATRSLWVMHRFQL
ncbi:MAG: UbiA family prenyltransferase, partial [Bacteroidetes bacterium]|nr:UbiA family prenyltransferase [Bacteroidota bacterium]